MKKSTIILALVILTVFSLQSVFAQTSATQSVTIQVAAVSRISVTGTVSLLIDAGTTAGLTSTSSATSTFNVLHNGTAGKITASINTAVPSGTTLLLTLQGGSQVDVGVATTAIDALTGLSKTKLANQSITYNFSADETAGVVASTEKTITFTVTGS